MLLKLLKPNGQQLLGLIELLFLKAADLISTKYRYDMLAATMLGQGKMFIKQKLIVLLN